MGRFILGAGRRICTQGHGHVEAITSCSAFRSRRGCSFRSKNPGCGSSNLVKGHVCIMFRADGASVPLSRTSWKTLTGMEDAEVFQLFRRIYQLEVTLRLATVDHV